MAATIDLTTYHVDGSDADQAGGMPPARVAPSNAALLQTVDLTVADADEVQAMNEANLQHSPDQAPALPGGNAAPTAPRVSRASAPDWPQQRFQSYLEGVNNSVYKDRIGANLREIHRKQAAKSVEEYYTTDHLRAVCQYESRTDFVPGPKVRDRRGTFSIA